MHRGDASAMAGHADEAHQPLRARLDQRLERALRTERRLPFVFIDEIVHLNEIDLINAQALQRALHAVARTCISSIAGLGREEEILAMLAHPRTDAQFRVAI